MPQESLGSLSSSCMALLEPLFKVKSYQDGEIIHARGERKAGLCVVLEGSVKVGNYGSDGRYFLSKLLKPYESFGEFTVFSQLPRTHTSEAKGETKIGYISPTKLKRALSTEPAIALALLQSLSTRLHLSLEALDDAKRLPVLVRVAKMIYAINLEEGKIENRHLSQDDIATQLGVSRMVVSTSLKQLTELGLIKKGYRHIQIIDLEKFNAWLSEQQQTMELLR